MSERLFESGSTIVCADDAGDSMYVVFEWLPSVFVEVPAKPEAMNVGQVEPGEFFGETSLLTGAPVSASLSAATDCVDYEIAKDDLAAMLQERPELATTVSELVAKRQTANLKAQDRARLAAEQEAQIQTLASQILLKMQSFFGGRTGSGA